MLVDRLQQCRQHRLAEDEVVEINRMHVTTPARTALDLACRNPTGRAVAAIDSLANATDLKVADVELLCQRYRGRRGVTRALAALNLVDASAESPRETWLRLLLLRAGFPRAANTNSRVRRVQPTTSIARLDTG